MLFMVQKEVAERHCSWRQDYGRLSVMMARLFEMDSVTGSGGLILRQRYGQASLRLCPAYTARGSR